MPGKAEKDPSLLIQFEFDKDGKMELVVAKELWSILRREVAKEIWSTLWRAVETQPPGGEVAGLESTSNAVRISVTELSFGDNPRVGAIADIQDPPCTHGVTVRIES